MTPFSTERFVLMTTDPVHIGTGGARLGRVDNSIVREPGTRLPKIPGTSLSGAIRQYAAYHYGKRRCAGQGGHCGQPTCPICYTFGFVKGDSGQQAHAGVVSIGDARLLLFPVYSLAGPVWVTSPGALRDFDVFESDPGDKARLSEALNKHTHLNLGWLMLEKDDAAFQWPNDIQDAPAEIKNRTVLVSDKLFSQIVNSNLEVRTSVSINPETGAAEEGALFTYEAIPRAAFLWMNVVVDDYLQRFPSPDRLQKWLKGEGKDFAPNEKPNRDDLTKAGWKDDGAKGSLEKYRSASLGWGVPADVVSAGLEWAEHLGIGGMGTRGFGRIKLMANWPVTEEVSHA